MPEPRRRRSVSQAQLWSLLDAQLDSLVVAEWRPLDVVDLGGGTGGLAASLAERGHRVTVVDPSPDALASLQRRTAEAGLSGRLHGVQGDAAELTALVGPGQVDLVVCHRVLDVVDSPAETLRAAAAVLRPGGALSLLVSLRHAVVLTQALSGHLAAARRTLSDPQRFDYGAVIDLVRGAGFRVLASDGIGAVAAHVPESVVEGSAAAYAELVALEAAISRDPAFRAIAPQVHVFGQLDQTPRSPGSGRV